MRLPCATVFARIDADSDCMVVHTMSIIPARIPQIVGGL